MKKIDLFKMNQPIFLNQRILVIVASLILIQSCSKDDAPEPAKPVDSKATTISIDPTVTHQEMIGFGGALTWYSDRVISSSKKNEIGNLIFGDLGLDIIRLKNWYYPDNYPASKSTDAMADDNSKANWSVTNQLYDMAKAKNTNVKILLSSWGPPAGLKSNNSSREGTLKKNGAKFMYNAFADYWVDVLDNLPFTPDYISIQNEPTFINSGWTTCQWSSTETASLPDYTKAFDSVYYKIKDRENVPVMIGPESQDVPTFSSFASILKNKDYCGAFAYHPYNINSSSSSDQIASSLSTIGSFGTKPNIMTEFSDNLSWMNTAIFIQSALTKANSSGYIYWKLVWGTPDSGTDAGMVSINSSGQYTVTPFYYLMKHFSKEIDAGYKRIDISSTNAYLKNSAFISPDGKEITIILINSGSTQTNVKIDVTGKTMKSLTANQTSGTTYYKELKNLSLADAITIPAQSITTLVASF